MQAFGGLMSVTGEDGREPVRIGPSIVDQGSAMWAVIGILSALHRRTQPGEGCEVDTSLYETALAWTDHARGDLSRLRPRAAAHGIGEFRHLSLQGVSGA